MIKNKLIGVAGILCQTAACLLGLHTLGLAHAEETEFVPKIVKASDEGELAIKKFKVAPGLKTELFAAEPDVCNIVSFSIDEKGRFFVAETFRNHDGVLDIRGEMNGQKGWVDEDLACRTVDDRVAMLKRYYGDQVQKKIGRASERVQLVEDRNGVGKADYSSVFAGEFNRESGNTIIEGIGAGILARNGTVWYANIPDLWMLKDTTGSGKADFRKSLHFGFGVRVSFDGHDLHGLRMGPDGKIYMSMGDRGASVRTEGKTVACVETGSVYRCNPDGSELEIFAVGLRNPQCLTFDQYGNLFTGDNNADGGDKARWVYVVDGGDSGWRSGYQVINAPILGPWNQDKMWHTQWPGQAAFLVPPVALIANGPAGTVFYPGTGLPERYNDHFFLVDFRGGAGSCVHSFALKPNGVSFEMIDRDRIISEILATDVNFGVEGGLYVSDWVEGWAKCGKGRIYRLFDPENVKTALVRETKKLLAEGMDKRPGNELAGLLAHADMRVRQNAQFALADRGVESIQILTGVAAQNPNQLARLHAIWGLEQIARKLPAAADSLLPLLADADAEVRSQAAKMLGDRRIGKASEALIKMLQDSAPRPRFFAAISLGKLARPDAIKPLLAMLRENDDKDPFLRHAGVMGLLGCAGMDALLEAAKDESAAVRMGVLVTMRRMERAEIAIFLNDKEPLLVLEAARAINDVSINGALSDLAALLDRTLPPQAQAEPILRRALNANLRVGSADTAKRLARFAAASKEGVSSAMRIEALKELADWTSPGGRDRVTSLWRPLSGPRDAKIPAEALRPLLGEIMKSAPNDVRAATLQTAEKLGISDAVAPILYELAMDTNASTALRTEALKSLAARKDPRVHDALKLALNDNSSALRKDAAALLATVNPAEAAAYLSNILDTGFISDKQSAMANLAEIQDNAADPTLLKWMDKLLAGEVPNEMHLDLLDAVAKHPLPELKDKLAKFEASRRKDDPLAQYRETLNGGNATAGHKVFFEKQEALCLKCHQIGGKGGEVGPSLSGIGARQTREFILESIVLPNKVIAPGYESVTVKMKEGKIFVGTVRKEDEKTLLLATATDGMKTLEKAEIQTRKTGLSPMPEDLPKMLTKQELRNLIEYLAGLKTEDAKKAAEGGGHGGVK